MIVPFSACAVSVQFFASGEGPESERFVAPSRVETQIWPPST